MSEPKVSERMKFMVREMLKEIRHASRFNVMDYDSVDHLLSAIAEIEQRESKWREAAVALNEAALLMKGLTLTKRLGAAWHSLGPLWDEAVGPQKGEG